MLEVVEFVSSVNKILSSIDSCIVVVVKSGIVVEEDIKVSLFDTSLPPHNEIKNIKSNLDIRLINKLSQNVRVMYVRTVFFYLDF